VLPPDLAGPAGDTPVLIDAALWNRYDESIDIVGHVAAPSLRGLLAL
jgi:hypothetical protein